jgi:predicted double-glycine peptidase
VRSRRARAHKTSKMFAVAWGRRLAFPRWIRRCLPLIVLVRLAVPAACGPSCDRDSILPYVEIRSSGVVRQTNSASCGAAAVATLLSAIFGRPTGEGEILSLVAGHMAEWGVPAEGGIPALSLVFALAACGISAVGYKLDSPSLCDYFRRGGLPVIAHVLKPERHFVVLVGLAGDAYVVADPGWGWVRDETFVRFRAFSGIVLVPLPPPDRAEAARAAQVRILEEAEQLLGRLDVLRQWLP